MKFKKLKRFSFILSLLVIIVLVAGCTPKTDDPDAGDTDIGEKDPVVETTNFPKDIEDSFGNKVTIEEEPEKIVSLIPSNTEIVFALGLADKVVGISSADDYPPEALEKEQVGGYEGNNLERIIELETDLVLSYSDMAAESPDDYARLTEAGIKVLSFMPESVDETIVAIDEIGKATGSQEKAKEITDGMKDHRDEIVSKVKDAQKKTVFYEVWGDPLQTAGNGSFMDNLINLSNGENIAADVDGYANYDLETLVEKNPEVYIVADADPELTVEVIKERPGYADIDAIKNNNVHLVDANLTSRPGPRIVEGLEIIAKTIHPELFE